MSDDHRFVALVELMDSLGCSFVVKSPEDVGYVGAFLPEWCDYVLLRWVELIVCAYAGVATNHRLYACTECCFPMLLSSARKGRRCPVCDAAGAMTYRLPMHFLDPPERRKPAPKRPREQEPPDPAADPPAPTPTLWPNCSHSLMSRQHRCSYCNAEVPAP